MELRDYLRIVRRRWKLIVTTVLVVIAAAAAVTVTTTPLYASSAKVFVSTSAQSGTSEAYQGGLFSAQRVTSYADLVHSRQLAETVINDLRLRMSADTLAAKVTAETVPETVILELTVEDADPATAKALAQTYAEDLSDLVRELETPPGRSTAPVKATIVDPASTPGGPVSPQPIRNLGLGLILGLLLGVGLAVLREVLDTTIKSAEDLTELAGAPLLGNIAFDTSARLQPLITSLDSHAPRAEAFRVLRTNIQFIDVDSPEKVFVVTSAVPGEGKTSTAVNLAITLAQAGNRTLLIEGDLRRPRAVASLGLDNAVGVTTVLLGKVTLDDAIQKHQETDLHVLSSGAIPPNPAELLQSRAMSELLTRARGSYEVVIIDGPPLLPVTDAALLASLSDGAIVVARHGRTTRDQVAQSVDRLLRTDAHVVGVVMNMTPHRRRGGTYGYGYGYGYAPTAVEDATRKTPVRWPRRS